jgi:hypothetical protein
LHPALAILITAIAIVGSILIALGLRRFSRRVTERAAARSEERSKTLAQIPVVERVASYVAFVFVIGGLLAFLWGSDGRPGELRMVIIAAGVAAVAYLVWFSARWRHLR